MEWKSILKNTIPKYSINYCSSTSILVGIFRNVTSPEIFTNSRGKICVPDKFSVVSGESKELFYSILNYEVFSITPLHFQKSLLDLLFVILNRNIYNVIRFQCSDNNNSNNFILISALIKLLDDSIINNIHISILKRIIYLVGIVGAAGINLKDLTLYLTLLRKPSELTVSLLQAFKFMLGQDQLITRSVMIKKASPNAIFNFGGSGSGFTTHYSMFPFSREYQFCTWFRIENFELESKFEHTSNQQKAFNCAFTTVQHIITWQNSAHKGMDVFINKRILTITVSHQSRPGNTIIELSDYPLQAGVWYHLHIRHSKPRLSIFSSDELSIYIDQQLVLQENIRFPNLGKFPETKFSFGLNFDGQMTPIYLFSECISLPIIEIIARLDAGKPVESFDNGFNPIVVDLLHSITTVDRKIYSPIMSKVSMAFHPSRCMRNHALEVHSGRHAKLEGLTQPWIISNVRDLLHTLGGISCLYPLFPRLLIENNLCKTIAAAVNNDSSPLHYSTSPEYPGNSQIGYVIFTGLGSSLAELLEDYSSDVDNNDLDYSVLSLLRSDKEDCIGERCIGLLISIIAKCIAAHRSYQIELLNSGGIEMIEYALTCVPQEILQGEGELCVVSLIQLQTAASDLFILERKIKKLLLCNFSIWYRASFQFVSSLMSVILAAIKNDPILFTEILGVKSVIDALEYFTDFDYSKDEYYAIKVKPNDITIQNNNDIGTPFSTEEDSMKIEGNVDINKRSTITDETNQSIIKNEIKFSPERIKTKISSRLTNILEHEELDFDSHAGSSTKFNSLNGFSTKTELESTNSNIQTPKSVSRRGIKRLKSFKNTLTEVIQIQDDFIEDKDIGIACSHDDITNGSSTSTSMHDVITYGNNDEYNRTIVDSNHSSDTPHSRHTISLTQVPAALERDESNDSLAVSEISNIDPPAPQTNEQRKYLRDCLYAMIVAIVMQDGTEKELAPILEHLVVSKDLFLSNEVAQILLYLIVEGGSKFMSAMIAACNGSEEFASFVLLYLIHKPYEELRCTGIRILIHFYLRIDQVAASFINLTLKQRRRQSIIYRSMSNIAAQVAGRDQGLQRLQLCGGLALLVEIVSSHCKFSSELTYSALLELLLTKPGVKSQVTVQYTDLFDTSSSSYVVNYLSHNTIPPPNANNIQSNIFRSLSKDLKLNNVGQHTLVFAAAYLSPDQVHDEDVDMMNSTALPIFFELLPKLPIHVQGQIYSDLLALLKHSERNCHAFISTTSWHLCMFGLVCQLVSENMNLSSKTIFTNSILNELEKWSEFIPETTTFLTSMNIKKKTIFRSSSEYRLDRGLSLGGDVITSSLNHLSIIVPASQPNYHDELEHDMWFALGMKIYSTLLLHSIEFKYGWKEIDRSISQSYESDVGYSVAQTILSHVLNETTFSMRSKYRELQRLAKSKDSNENQEANDRIENLLCLLLTSSELALVDQQCTLTGIKQFHVCKLRVHYYSEICHEYGSIKDSTFSHPADNIRSTLTDAQIESILSPSEMRNILEKTEQNLSSSLKLINENEETSHIKYDIYGARLRKDKLHTQESNEHYYSKYLNFYHEWHDITGGDLKGNEINSNESHNSPIEKTLSKTNSFTIPNNLLSNLFQFKSTEELLHPLERNHDIFHGKLILVLQTLRLFDVIFWPNNAVLRNAEMLRFNKEELASVNDIVSSSSKSDKKRSNNSQSYPMSICSAVMRMCLFILTQLSPITHLAILNLKRMKMLVHSLDKIPQFKTPTHDWLLAIVLHTTLGMQRIAHSLEPVYVMLGITMKVHVESIGPWNDSYDDFDRLDSQDVSLFDTVSEDVEAMMSLQKYFDSSSGRNLIRNIRASLMLLADAFEFHHAKLSNCLEERFFRSLWVLVEHYRADCATNCTPVDKKRTNSSDEVEKEPPSTFGRSLSLKIFRQESIPVITSLNSNNEVAPEDLFDSGPYSPTSGGGSISSHSSIASTFSPKFAKINITRSSRVRSSSDISEISDVSSRTIDDENITSDDKGKFQMRGTTSPTPVQESLQESFKGADILLVLKWLRFPYFKLNPYRNIGVIKAVDALDYLEARSVNQFSKELQGLKEVLEEQRDLAVKSVEEMTELKELSLAVNDSMLARHESRVMISESSKTLKLKNIAAKWHSCLQRFEEDWSPWRAVNTTSTSIHNPKVDSTATMTHYELSKHRDFFLRRMVLTRLPEPISHKDAAYLEGKIKDQELFKAELLHGAAKPLSAPHPTNNINNNRISLPFRSRTLTNNISSVNTVNNNNLWGDEEDDNDDTSNTISTGIAGGIATLLTGGVIEKRPTWTLSFKWAADEKYLFEFEAMQIQLEQVVSGVVLLTNKCIYFHSRKHLSGLAVTHQPFMDRRWYLDRIIEAYGRRYLLQNCAIELFFVDSPELFLAFKSLSELQKFFRALHGQFIPLLVTPRSLNPRYAFNNSPWTDLWKRRLISNFEYLMRLNIMAGRSFNDITQYPVFPWVISDYTSKVLDLNNPKTFRKLELPVGALNPSRLEEFLERYRSFDDDSIPKFMYGSHYSSAGVVLHYMLRQEPFTTLAINLQGGRFDCPDRIFFDISRTWQNCNESMSDVKEMIPELFCCPEMLLNTNKLPLGNLQEESQLVDDVRLPPWAENAYDFVRYNRDALESDYVSEHLPSWIDLVFGYKQTGPNAVAANNVFVYLTYENAIDIDTIEDPLQKAAAKAQVMHYGQTPSQLLVREHPKRFARDDCIQPLCSDRRNIANIRCFTPTKQIDDSSSVIAISCSGDRLIACHSNLTLSYYRWSSFPDDDHHPFTCRPDKSKEIPSTALSTSEEILRGRNSLLQSSTPPLYSDGTLTSNNHLEASSLFGTIRNSFNRSKSTNLSTFLKNQNPALDELFPRINTINSTSNLNKDDTIGNKTIHNRTTCPVLTHMKVALHAADIGASRIISCSYWDNSLKIHSVESLREVASSTSGHKGEINCIQQGTSSDFNTIITGGADGTCRVWIFEKNSLAIAYTPDPYYSEGDSINDVESHIQSSYDTTNTNNISSLVCIHTLCGHLSPVSSISYSSTLDLVLSGGIDGLLCIHSVRSGQYIRSIMHPTSLSADLVLISHAGYIIAHSWIDLQIHLFWLNGQHLLSLKLPRKIETMIVDSTGLVLITGTIQGIITMHEISNLKQLLILDVSGHGAIKSLSFNEDNQFLLIGSEDGTFSIATDSDTRIKSFTNALQKLPILGTGI